MIARASPVLLLAAAAAAAGLNDPRIVSASASVSLDGPWHAASNAASMAGTVPGDVITDLQNAKLIGDPLFELNFKNATLWNRTWTYTKIFAMPKTAQADSVWWVVFDGIKMGATISANGAKLGEATDQFVKYRFPITLKASNTLTVAFDIPTNGRYMACTGGWDWGPYSTTYHGKDHTFSFGIWKSVYLLPVAAASGALTGVVPEILYKGAHPVLPLADGKHAGFAVNVKVHLHSAAGLKGTVSVSNTWGAAVASAPVAVAAGDSVVSVALGATAEQVKLWWPRGKGAQPRYNLTVTVTAGGAKLSATRTVGFRVVHMITTNDTDASYVAKNANADGSGNHGMMFRVNGGAMYAKGANFIPMDNMEGRYTASAHDAVVKSASDSNVNFLRIWGGGVFLPEAFYEAADKYGVMLFHDMMFSTTSQTHEPKGTAEEKAELQNAIRRLAHRPSIALWNSCNECSASGLYVSLVMTTVAQEDASRPIWPGCPSDGWAAGVNRLSGLPNGKKLESNAGMRENLLAKNTALALAAPKKTCTFVKDTGYQNPAGGKATGAATQEECCTQCQANPHCVVGVFIDKTCWQKYDNTGKVSKKGIVACDTGKTPIPIPKKIETHGPYNHGNGWMAVNISPYPRKPPYPKKAPLKLFNANTPIKIDAEVQTGVALQNIFASEFGCSVFSSFESMAPTLGSKHWSVHGGGPQADCTQPDRTNAFWRDCKGVDGATENPMAERNYPCDPLIMVYFGTTGTTGVSLDAVGKEVFQRQLYLCQVAQGIEMSADIETRRSKNTFGTLTWQLNEIWPTGGWGSLEYGTVATDSAGKPLTAGQVNGGRWRPLQYMFKQSLYADVMATCGVGGACYVKNDGFGMAKGSVVVTEVALGGKSGTAKTQTVPIDLPAGPGAMGRFQLQSSFAMDNKHVYTVACLDASGAVLSKHVSLHMAPKDLMVDDKASVKLSVDGMKVTASSASTVLYVTLVTLAQGRFSDNAFLLPAGESVTAEFVPFAGFDAALFKSSLRVEHV